MVNNVIAEWKKNKFSPVYWFEGEEAFYIDQLVDYAEEHILSGPEKEFNLTVLYGKDSDWAQVINSCRRYPMFSEKQVVIVKEAQQLKDIDKLESYIEKPLSSTILVIAYKDKKIDGRTKFAKTVKEKGQLFNFKKLYDNQLPEWTGNLVKEKGYSIRSKALLLLVEHVGNDLNRLQNEIHKLTINLAGRTEITEDDIEKYIGISKEYNVFELQNAIANKNMPKAIQILQYFENNPKSGPLQLILPTLYSFFSKVFLIFAQNTPDEKQIATAIGVHPFLMKDYSKAAHLYQFTGVEKSILLLQHYNLRSLGIGNGNNTDAGLLKELIYKIIQH